MNDHEPKTKTDNAELSDSTLWTADDVATFSKTSRSWVYQKSASGQLPCLKIGGLLRFDPAAIRAFFLSGGTAERTVIPLNNPKAPSKGR